MKYIPKVKKMIFLHKFEITPEYCSRFRKKEIKRLILKTLITNLFSHLSRWFTEEPIIWWKQSGFFPGFKKFYINCALKAQFTMKVILPTCWGRGRG